MVDVYQFVVGTYSLNKNEIELCAMKESNLLFAYIFTFFLHFFLFLLVLTDLLYTMRRRRHTCEWANNLKNKEMHWNRVGKNVRIPTYKQRKSPLMLNANDWLTKNYCSEWGTSTRNERTVQAERKYKSRICKHIFSTACARSKKANGLKSCYQD